MVNKEICHVCGKEKKPYTVFLKNNLISLLKYKEAREKGSICQRCDQYFAMTGEFKDASQEEFENAKKAVWFAKTMLKWWEKDKKLNSDSTEESKRSWEGTEFIAKWCRNLLNKK